MIPIEVVQGDIAALGVDLLVNASNTVLRLGSGVSGAIRRSCGAAYQDKLNGFLAAHAPDGLQPGEVVITDAGAHPRAKWVAHVAVMDYRERDDAVPRPDLARIRLGATQLWQKISELSAPVSVGMVALGAGTGGMGLRDTTKVACETLKAQLDTHPGAIERVVFVSYDMIEYLNATAVIRQSFPHADLSAMSEDERRMMESLDK